MKILALSCILMSVTCAFFKPNEIGCKYSAEKEEELLKAFEPLSAYERHISFFPLENNIKVRIKEFETEDQYALHLEEMRIWKALTDSKLDSLVKRGEPCILKHDSESTIIAIPHTGIKQNLIKTWDSKKIDYDAPVYWSNTIERLEKIVELVFSVLKSEHYFTDIKLANFGEMESNDGEGSFKIIDASEIVEFKTSDHLVKTNAAERMNKILPDFLKKYLFPLYNPKDAGTTAYGDMMDVIKNLFKGLKKVGTEKEDYLKFLTDFDDEFGSRLNRFHNDRDKVEEGQIRFTEKDRKPPKNIKNEGKRGGFFSNNSFIVVEDKKEKEKEKDEEGEGEGEGPKLIV